MKFLKNILLLFQMKCLKKHFKISINVEFEVNGFHLEIYPLMRVVQIKDNCIKYLIY